MPSRSLIHGHAMALAEEVLAVVAPCLREEERAEAFGLFVEAAEAVLTRYEEKADRPARRLGPRSN